jgi:hypothetical protein
LQFHTATPSNWVRRHPPHSSLLSETSSINPSKSLSTRSQTSSVGPPLLLSLLLLLLPEVPVDVEASSPVSVLVSLPLIGAPVLEDVLVPKGSTPVVDELEDEPDSGGTQAPANASPACAPNRRPDMQPSSGKLQNPSDSHHPASPVRRHWASSEQANVPLGTHASCAPHSSSHHALTQAPYHARPHR